MQIQMYNQVPFFKNFADDVKVCSNSIKKIVKVVSLASKYAHFYCLTNGSLQSMKAWSQRYRYASLPGIVLSVSKMFRAMYQKNLNKMNKYIYGFMKGVYSICCLLKKIKFFKGGPFFDCFRISMLFTKAAKSGSVLYRSILEFKEVSSSIELFPARSEANKIQIKFIKTKIIGSINSLFSCALSLISLFYAVAIARIMLNVSTLGFFLFADKKLL